LVGLWYERFAKLAHQAKTLPGPSPITFESRSNVAAIGTEFQSREALQAAVDSRQHRDNAVDL
jgi:hypothetical protein